MPFNHYAKIKRILHDQPEGWVIKKIDQPTKARNFKGEEVRYQHYYRIYDTHNQQIKYCKFQKLDLLARTLGVPAESLPVIDAES